MTELIQKQDIDRQNKAPGLDKVILQRLKEETAESHQKMESIDSLKRIFDGTNDLENYAFLISCFYSFIQPIEQSITGNVELKNKLKVFLPDYEERLRTPLLEKDLKILNIKDVQRKNSLFPQINSLERCFGYLYVMEGSSLGGMRIHKVLSDTFKAQDNSEQKEIKEFNYFYTYGSRTMEMWRLFCSSLTQFSAQSPNEEQIIDTAKETFAKLYCHFTN